MGERDAVSQTHRYAGALLAVGCGVFVAGAMVYIPLGTSLGLPSLASSYGDAIGDARRLGSAMALAGRLTFLGDAFIACAAFALLGRRRIPSSDLEPTSWSLLGVSFLVATTFDSVMGTALAPLSGMTSDSPFTAFKTWYDFLFAAGAVPFGAGAAGTFMADARSAVPRLPRVVDLVGMLGGVLAFIGGAGYLLHLFVSPILLGTPLLLVALPLGALGIQIARREG